MHDHTAAPGLIDRLALVNGAIHALLWTTPYPDEDGGDVNGYLDKDKTRDDVLPDDGVKLWRTLLSLVTSEEHGALFDGLEYEQIGHDFILTANGHGAGFWDRGLGERGDQLTELVRPFGTIDAYVDDEGKVRITGLPD
jgi:hypothetical protein